MGEASPTQGCMAQGLQSGMPEPLNPQPQTLLGGSWVLINGVISRVTIHIRGLITPLIATHEPPSSPKP